MSTCTAAEIAEKRRIALEKLQATKQKQKQPKLTENNSLSSSSFNNASTSVAINKQQIVNTHQENSFKSALNALKQNSKLFSFNKDSYREASHPYHRSTNDKSSHSKGPVLTAGSKTNYGPKLAPVFINSVSCKIYMITNQSFAVNPSAYHEQLINVFKTIPSKSYDSKTRIWSFDLTDYQLVRERVSALNPHVVIGVIPQKVLDLCSVPPKKIELSCLMSIESTLADKLLPFQKEGVCFAIAQHGRLMICDEMGLGKTFQALAVADYYKEHWPLLICTTASTRDSWSSHIRDLLPSVPLHYVQVLNCNGQYFNDAKVLIISYAMLGNHLDKLMQHDFGFLIFDESHQLKNPKAKCSISADRLARKAKHVILLSGTPALSRPQELFTQLQMIDRKFMNFMEFTTRYCDGKQTHFGWDASGQSNLPELNVILKLKFMIRRTKADVLPDLAEKHRETVILDPALVWPNDDVKATLSKLNKDFSASKGKEKEEILLRFYAQTAEVKIKAVCSYLKTLVKEKFKFIVFAHHRVMMDAICDCLNKLGVVYVRIDGQTRQDQRAEYIDLFQKKPACTVAVLSLKACNSGITLTAAEMIIFAELDWNPSTLAQAESRAHRIGQDKPVTCRYLMASKTADDIIWKMLKQKQEVLNKVGLFCENLQDATLTAAPTISSKIEQYFSPDRLSKNKDCLEKSPIELKSFNETKCQRKIADYMTPKKLPEQKSKHSIQLDNMDDFFGDDDVFKDIIG